MGKPAGSRAKLRISRRAALQGAASVAVAAVTAGRGLVNSAQAETTAAAALPMADPYTIRINAGPSSVTVPAVGATPAVPGTPYIVPTDARWSCTSLFASGNEINGYRMAGVPDGLGAFDNGDGTITVLMNHEIDAGDGAFRGHGGKGAFVSRWVIDKTQLRVVSGRDFVATPDKLMLWRDGAWILGSSVTGPEIDIDRLCSADLAPISAYYNATSKLGYDGHIFLNGEEGEHNANRAFAWIAAEGTAYELPAFAFGKPGDEDNPPPCWENLLGNPATGDATVVLATSDGGPSEVYCYIGAKQADGSPIEKAGLTDGRIFSLRVAGVAEEKRDGNIGITKSRLGKGKGRRVSLAAPQKGTAFLRPEDGAWDIRNPNVFYFTTTDRNNFARDGSVRPGENAKQVGRARLWAVTFDDVSKIATDGRAIAKIELLIDGTEGGDMFDNITVDRAGVVYLCEDAGDARHSGRIWAYDTKTGKLTAIMRFDPAKFGDVVGKKYTPPTPPFVDDKETSGILDVTALFEAAKWFRPGSTVLLVTVQAHFDFDSKHPLGDILYEGGQLLLLVKAP